MSMKDFFGASAERRRWKGREWESESDKIEKKRPDAIHFCTEFANLNNSLNILFHFEVNHQLILSAVLIPTKSSSIFTLYCTWLHITGFSSSATGTFPPSLSWSNPSCVVLPQFTQHTPIAHYIPIVILHVSAFALKSATRHGFHKMLKNRPHVNQTVLFLLTSSSTTSLFAVQISLNSFKVKFIDIHWHSWNQFDVLVGTWCSCDYKENRRGEQQFSDTPWHSKPWLAGREGPSTTNSYCTATYSTQSLQLSITTVKHVKLLTLISFGCYLHVHSMRRTGVCVDSWID